MTMQQLLISTDTFTTHQNRVHGARNLDNNPLQIHSPIPVRINLQQLFLKIPVSISLQDPSLLVVTRVTKDPTGEPGENAGAFLAMNRARNSPVCPISKLPSPLSALCYRFSHTRCQQKNKNNAERCLVCRLKPGSDFRQATKTHSLTPINPFAAAITRLGGGWQGKATQRRPDASP